MTIVFPVSYVGYMQCFIALLWSFISIVTTVFPMLPHNVTSLRTSHSRWVNQLLPLYVFVKSQAVYKIKSYDYEVISHWLK